MEGTSARSGKARIFLTPEQRGHLQQVSRTGKTTAKRLIHARVLLLADEADPAGRQTDKRIGQALGVHEKTVSRIRRRFLSGGLTVAVERKPRANPPTPPKLDGQAEATLVALCCSPPPQGRVRWTMQLLAQELVKRSVVVSICQETVRKALKKTSCSRGG